MPTNTEFTIHLEDQPGTLAQACRSLGDHKVNILALQVTPGGGKCQVRFVADNPTTAKTVLDREHISYTEAQVAQVRLANRPGQLAAAAARLGEAKINIDYLYSGLRVGHEHADPDLRRGRRGPGCEHAGGDRCWRCSHLVEFTSVIRGATPVLPGWPRRPRLD